MPSTPVSHRAVVIAAIFAVLAVAAIATGSWLVTDASDPQPIGHDASERVAELDGFAATVETTTVRNDRTTTRLVQRVERRPGTGTVRIEPIDVPEGKRWLVVSNGSTTWQYSRPRQRVETFVSPASATPDDLEIEQREGEWVERLFRRLDVSAGAVDQRTRANTTVTVSPLPVVPPSDGTASPTPSLNSSLFHLEYRGTDRTAGRRAYVLRIESADDTGTAVRNHTQTLFVDTEWFVILRTHTEVTVDGERLEQTRTYRNVSFNPGLDDDRFTFTPPPDATVETVTRPSEPVASYGSLAELRAAVEFPVPEPEIPATLAFRSGTLEGAESSVVRMEYANATARVVVEKNRETAGITRVQTAGEESADVGGNEGIYDAGVVRQSLSWQCENVAYSVTGEGISKERLLQIAESVTCQ
jgi:outer membrane lipoprotein-sorting protein